VNTSVGAVDAGETGFGRVVAPSHEQWRSGIQALRGLSVIAVILNHLGLSWIPGGYLGVDIFFVISGFVITGSFLRNTQPSSRWVSLHNFWLRRFFRLWPSLFMVVLATTTFLVLTSAARPGSILTGFTSLFGLSNVRLLVGRLEYFALDTNADWFMHLWSLSVEEQIYLLLSLVFLACVKSQDGIGRVRTRLLGIVLAIGVIISLAFALATTTSEVVRFYSPHTRFYQVGVGALLAVGLIGRAGRPGGGSSRGVRRVAGPTMWVALLGICLLLAIEVEPLRIGSLMMTTSAALVITALVLGEGHLGIRRVPFLIMLGDRSYSLYLVHWPIQLASEILLENPWAQRGVSLVATVVVGSIASQLVEMRFRFWHTTTSKARSSLFAMSSIVLVAIVTAGAFAWAERKTRPLPFNDGAGSCNAAHGSWWLIGDSHLRSQEGSIFRATGGDCTVIGGRGKIINYLVLDESPDGRQFHRAFLVNPDVLISQITSAEKPPQALLIVHWLTGYLAAPDTAPASANAVTTEWYSDTGESIGRERFVREFELNLGRIADALKSRGGTLVVVSPPPDFNWLRFYVDPVHCSGRFFVSRECAMTRTEARITAAEHATRGGGYRLMLDNLAGTHDNALHIALDAPFCNRRFCSNFKDGILVFGDDDHLNQNGVNLVAHYFNELAAKLGE